MASLRTQTAAGAAVCVFSYACDALLDVFREPDFLFVDAFAVDFLVDAFLVVDFFEVVLDFLEVSFPGIAIKVSATLPTTSPTFFTAFFTGLLLDVLLLFEPSCFLVAIAFSFCDRLVAFF